MRFFVWFNRLLIVVLITQILFALSLNVTGLEDYIIEFSFIYGMGLFLYALYLFSKKEVKELRNRSLRYSLLTLGLTIIIWFLSNIIVCGFAITDARNIFTGQCKIFPSTCTPPWYKSDVSCPGGVEIIN